MSFKTDDLLRNGLTSLQAGKLAEAEDAFTKVLRRERAHIGALNLLGIVLTQLGRFSEAETYLAAALKQTPNSDATLSNYGVVLKALRRPADALERFDQALAINPAAADTWNSRGAVLHQLERCEEAIVAFDRAIALNPRFAEAFDQKARALEILHRDQEALAASETALALNPQLAEAWYCRAIVLLKLDRREDAFQSFGRAAAGARTPAALVAANAARATALLSLARFQEGWEAYEWRTQASDFAHASSAIEARIVSVKSRNELVGKAVAVIAEQGVGDEIMFASILPDLLRDAKTVTYELDPRLIGLFSQSFPAVNFVARQRPEEIARGESPRELSAGQFDLTIRAGNLGFIYRPDLKSFPRKSYLKLRSDRVERWRTTLGASEGKRQVGICWRGGTKKTGTSDRSMTLEQMKPLLDRPDCQFVSLQYGDVADEIETFNRTSGGKIRYFPKDQINDFEELGGLIEALDLVVSVQNTTVHLCGALGKTCLAMLPRHAEWRYGTSGKEMAWYSSVELWRQSQRGDWAGVLRDVNQRLNVEGEQ